MKFKALVAVSIALLMLLTLVAPVLAGPNRLTLTAVGTGEAGTGTATIRVTHDNYCKVTIDLEGAGSLKTYNVWVYDGTDYHWAGDAVTDEKGNDRFSGTTYEWFPSGVLTCKVALGNVSDQIIRIAYITNSVDLTFK